MRAFIAFFWAVSAVAAFGCTPSECGDVLERTTQIEEALRGDLSAAREPAGVLAESLAKAGPKWVPMRAESERLAAKIERAGRAPESPEQGAHDARELKAAVEAWQSAAKEAREICR